LVWVFFLIKGGFMQTSIFNIIRLVHLFTAIALCGLVNSGLWAATYYLAPAGSDAGAGSIGNPWGTLGKANSVLAAGDTLLIRGGTYTGMANVVWTKSGTAGQPVLISAYPGERPIFTGGGALAFIKTKCSYVVFDGLEITNYVRWAFSIDTNSTDVTVRNCYMHQIQALDHAAIVIWHCHHITVENNKFEEMGRSLAATLHDHAIYNSAGAHDVTIRNNFFKNNYGGPAVNHYHTPSPYNVWIYNNVFVMTMGSERSGVYVGDGSNHISIYNNSFYLEGTGGLSPQCYAIRLQSGGGTNVVKNNLTYFANWNIQDALEALPGDTIDYNLYYPALDAGDGGAHSFSADPLLTDVAGGDFHLTALSPARGAGETVSLFTTDFDGQTRPSGAYDIGAFQYAGGSGLDRSGTDFTRQGQAAFSIFPNPSPGLVFIQGPSGPIAGGRARYALYDVAGRLLDEVRLVNGQGCWNGAAVPAGIYLLIIETGGTRGIQKVQIAR
jgi:hypothetical protein